MRNSRSTNRYGPIGKAGLVSGIAKALSRMLLMSMGVHFISFVSLPLVDEVRPPVLALPALLVAQRSHVWKNGRDLSASLKRARSVPGSQVLVIPSGAPRGNK